MWNFDSCFLFTEPHPKTNWKLLNTPQKSVRVQEMRLRAKRDARKMSAMRKRFDKLIQESSCVCDDEVSNLVDGVREYMEALPSNDARRMFWEQQVHNYTMQNIYTYVGQIII